MPNSSLDTAVIEGIGTGTRYQSIPFSFYPIDQIHAVLNTRLLPEPRVVLKRIVHALTICRVPRSLNEHIQVITREIPGGADDAIRMTVETLVKAGLLTPCGSEPLATTDDRCSLSTLAVLTADRPLMLERCLESYASHLAGCGRRPRVVVVDHSAAPEHAARNRRTLTDTAARWGFDGAYLGIEARRALCESLVAAGCERRVVEHAVGAAADGSKGDGAARNLLHLATAGEPFLAVADDSVCAPWSLGTSDHSLVLTGHADPHHYEFFDARESAILVEQIAGDLCAAHEHLLGRSVGALYRQSADRADITQSCVHLLAALRASHSSRIYVTQAGVAGHAGSRRPLFAHGSTRARMSGDQDYYELAVRASEARRIVDAPTVAHRLDFPLICSAFDNRSLLPPWLPGTHSIVPAFGGLLSAIDPAGAVGHVPVGVVFDPPAAADGGNGRHAPLSFAFGDIVALLLRGHAPSDWIRDDDGRLRRVSLEFRQMNRLRPADFEELLRHHVLHDKTAELTRIDEAIASYPDYWRAGWQRYRSAMLETIEDQSFYLASDVTGDTDRLPAMQYRMTQVGDLLDAWPELVRAARTLPRQPGCTV